MHKAEIYREDADFVDFAAIGLKKQETPFEPVGPDSYGGLPSSLT